ncbi:MAG TPA: hypothetical protein ENN60_00090 [archaeon]|nr:hypothetical protein [archaeon]
MYYPNYYWVQQNHYPPPPTKSKAWLPWAVIFLLILVSFYTIYIYIQPEFVLREVDCSQNYVVAHFIMSKSGRFFMGNFELNIGGKIYEKKMTSIVTEGELLDVVFHTSLAPGSYQGTVGFRGVPAGTFSCLVR